MSRFSQPLLLAVALALLCLATAHTTRAAQVVYATRNAFDIAVPNYTTITFDGHAVPYANSLTFSGVTFAGGNANFQVGVIEGTNVGTPGNYVLTSNTNVAQFNVDNILITPPTGTRAFGFDLKSSNAALAGQAAAGTYEIYVNGTLAATVAVPIFTGFSFVGFTSDVDITSVAIRALTGGDPVIDNVSFSGAAPAAETPEPATLVLLGTGLAGGASVARRRRRVGTNNELT